ncbi:rhodanese-like domain-containing protein [Rhodococcus tukisamuensis]|uniref:rhodanese-like domain-containing protein n=1 Tax=Rhodococcus tukisamuensis TaxID=168276 RepID=UPI0009328EFF|nr:rhodanese-like domain-containing protein [Rhodococcus tukisamuensis]
MSFGDVPSVEVGEVPADPYDAAVLLDVREDYEWADGHAPGALHIPMVDVPARLDEIDIDAEVYVVCRQGGRSIQVVAYLNQIGYDAVNVSGGMVAWQHTGRPLTADDGRSAKIY